MSLGPRLQCHDRCLGRSKRRIGVKVLVCLAPPSPKARPFIASRGPGPDHAGPVGETNLGVRPRLQVEPPGRLALTPAVHRHRDDIGAILEIAEDDAAPLAGTAPGGGQLHRAPPIGLRTPQPDPATSDAVQAAMLKRADHPISCATWW